VRVGSDGVGRRRGGGEEAAVPGTGRYAPDMREREGERVQGREESEREQGRGGGHWGEEGAGRVEGCGAARLCQMVAANNHDESVCVCARACVCVCVMVAEDHYKSAALGGVLPRVDTPGG
jgi:hypothetical protein